eukprot:12910794-Prorocentrum_lima.AAC.1
MACIRSNFTCSRPPYGVFVGGHTSPPDARNSSVLLHNMGLGIVARRRWHIMCWDQFLRPQERATHAQSP